MVHQPTKRGSSLKVCRTGDNDRQLGCRLAEWVAPQLADMKDAYRGGAISGQHDVWSLCMCRAGQKQNSWDMCAPVSDENGWPAAYLVVIEGEADHIATQLGCIIGPLTAQIVHPNLASMELGQELVDSWQTVAKEACRARPRKLRSAVQGIMEENVLC